MSFQSWSVAEKLPRKEPFEVQFSRGFLRARPELWFAHLGTQWLQLFHSLASTPKFVGATTDLNFPSELQRLTVIEVDDERAVLGMDEQAVRQISSLVTPEMPEMAADIFLEYLERRFCSTLRAAWTEDEPMLVQYLSNGQDQDVEVSGSVRLRFQLNSSQFDMWVGCGPKLMSRLDNITKEALRSSAASDLGDQVRTVSVEIAELWVPPALLIDYMRAGTVIDLEKPLGTEVNLLLESEPWGTGQLCRANDTLAVEVLTVGSPKRQSVEGKTHLSIVIASTQLDAIGLLEHRQRGAILSLGTVAPESADIVIGGETVATAELGEVDGRLAVQVQAMK